MSSSFTRMATVTASTLRSPAMVGGKSGSPVENIASIMCTPIVPVGDPSQWRETLALKSLTAILETFVQGDPDIIANTDFLVVGDIQYPIRFVNIFPFGGEVRKQLILEGIKR